MFTCHSLLIFAAGIFSSNCHPIDPKVVLPVADGFGIVILATAFLISSVVVLIACSCCKERRDGFKEFQNPDTREIGFSNALSSELAIFPPPGSSPPPSSPRPQPAGAPLTQPSKPAAFSAVIPSISDWFGDPNANFPRQQLFYQKEIGKGWFGKVVKGEGRGVKVVVRILREDATPEEKAYFLHEARPFRDLRHKNIARLFGRCLENDPFLLLFHFSANGDLKSFLVTNSGSRNAITEQKISLKMMLDVTEGLKFMNENGFIHTDLAARNCLVASDLTVKIGDYGTSIDKYKNEYYITGDVAIPLRWCAPETLTITPTTIETNQVTEEGNVWSLGVVLWEIAEFGKLPYSNLSDEQVIIQVLGDGNLHLSQPSCSFGEYLYHIMISCWKKEGRATIDNVLAMLVYLKNNPFQDEDFEARWRMLKPNTVAVVDNHTPIHSPRHTLLAQRPQLPAKLEFDSGVDLEIKPTDENPDSCLTSTPITVSPQLSVTSDVFQPTQHRSPSLTNLKGSLEDVTQFDSWLTGVDQKTEEDRNFVKDVSEAIKNLDETLALEKTSSSSADSSMDGSKKPLLDFRLGPQEGERKVDSLSSDTEEETWRKRIERGEFSEKVKEKSKSVTDLMVLTHIESEGSESDSLPSLSRQCSLRKGGVIFTGVGFGSEGNIRKAVLSDELQDKLRQLALWRTDTDQSFLGIGASETIHLFKPPPKTRKCDVMLLQRANLKSDLERKGDSHTVNNGLSSVNIASVMKDKVLETVNTQSKDIIIKVEDISLNKQSCVDNETSRDDESGKKGVQSDSSHSEGNTVPKIVITESELSESLPESESDLETQYFVNIKPRKFVFVCRDMDDDDELIEHSSNNVPPQFVNSTPHSFSDGWETRDRSGNSELERNDSSVILGPCNEHTLDYFKGLKTTFMPAEELYSTDYTELNEADLMCDLESDSSDNDKRVDSITLETNQNYTKEYPLPDLVPEISNRDCKSSMFSDEIENCFINDVNKNLEHSVEIKNDLNISNSISISGKVIYDELHNNDDGDEIFFNDEKYSGKKDIINNKNLNSKDTLSKISPIAGANFLNSSSSNSSSDSESQSSSTNSSEEQLVEAPYPFNQPLLSENHIKSKSLDSFLTPKDESDDFSSLVNGALYENHLNSNKNFIAAFSMTESVSENAFIDKNAGYDPYFSVDSGHSSERCMEQDKQMNDLKSRLEDVVKMGSDFQLKNSEEEYGGKLLTPDDERSSDSGFRDKGSLSESVEDTCDEKYNLEDIDAELDDFTTKPIHSDDFRYYELVNERDSDNSRWVVSTRPDASSKENGWLSQSTENEESLSLSIDAEFAAAIRNELKEKLPCAQQNEKSDEDNSPEGEELELNTDSANQFVYPSQLSPILEEQESNQSSLQLNDLSPSFILPPPDLSHIESHEGDEGTSDTTSQLAVENLLQDNAILSFTDDKTILDDDVLIVDTETNEATIIESPKPPSNSTFILPFSADTVFGNGCSPDVNSESFILTPENAPSTPNSFSTDSHSSPEHGNLSGFFLSPCSIRSDLFDSGPPSLPFDLGQSLEEVEDLPLQKEEESFENMDDGESRLTSDSIATIPENNFKDNIKCHTFHGKDNVSKISRATQDDISNRVEIADILNQSKDNLISDTECGFDHGGNNDNSKFVSKEAHATDNERTSVSSKDSDKKINQPGKEELAGTEGNGHLPSPEPELTAQKPSTGWPPQKDPKVIPWLKDLVFTSQSFDEIRGNAVESTKSQAESHPARLDELVTVKKQGAASITSTLALLSPEVGGEGGDSRPWIGADPMPSPEDGWRPTISQLMELTEAAAEGEEMTTSFIDPDPNGTYTPDWESDLSESSSSGEFLWKEGDKEDFIKCVASDSNSLLEEMGPVMERIEEEDEYGTSSSDSEESSEGSISTDFRPSTWNSMATPARPILRVKPPSVKNSDKRVVFKKEKYQCVYEYPREESDSDEEPSWQTPVTSLFDYSVFADWELGEGEVAAPAEGGDSDSEDAKSSNNLKEYDFYRLDYNPTSQSEWRECLPGSDAEFSPLASDLTPVRLGDLRHTKSTLRLELPPLRPDQGEASILDSASHTV